MNKKYYKDMFGGAKYGDYIVYDLDKSESKYSDYYNQTIKYYDIETIITEESEEQKAFREAKEKAEKRNNKIDQLLEE
jgi:hypothetical protein